MSAEVIQVIRTTLSTRGGGRNVGDPIRIVIQYWTLDGELLAEHDPWLSQQIADLTADVARLRVLLGETSGKGAGHERK
jgi:hypothetical protein